MISYDVRWYKWFDLIWYNAEWHRIKLKDAQHKMEWYHMVWYEMTKSSDGAECQTQGEWKALSYI